LGSGLADAVDGSKELRDKLKESVDKNIKKTNENKNKIQSEVMSAPVDIHDISIDIVNNNGTGFVPYFVPLALWVGGMAIFFLVDLNINKKKIWKQFMPKFWVSLMVSIIQVLTLDLVLVKLLGLKVNMLWQFVAFGILLGGCFAIIQMFLTLAFGLSGKFIGIVLLMLQLTSSAGSYPIETAPLFFQKIGPYLPMTYAVSALRELVSGSNKEIVIYDVKIIFVFTLVFIFALIFDLFKKNGLSSIKSLWIKKIK
jgi:putative membrane protein